MFALDLSLEWDHIGTPQGDSEDTTQNKSDSHRLPVLCRFLASIFNDLVRNCN